MFGRFGWAEILVIVVLVVILFGSNKIPGMMKNLADGLNVFKKEVRKSDAGKPESKKTAKKVTDKQTAKKRVVKKASAGK
ncbi:MAG: twin-arginine translocase TatA/TatE family subunit [Alphaproteobacteria bacterium]|nr:twin-arginine translocase TatA/TatE family subunit [Alphaproteobacteria bacterium]